MDSIRAIEKLLKLERELSILQEKFQERNKWCQILEFWLIKKFDYDAEYNSHLFEQAKENERRRRSKETYMDQEGHEFPVEPPDTFNGPRVISQPQTHIESSTLLPPYSQIRTNFHAQNKNYSRKSHVDLDEEMEMETKQEECFADSTVADSGQESQDHSRFNEEKEGNVSDLLDDDLDNFDLERPIVPDLATQRNDEISNLARAQFQDQSSENLLLTGGQSMETLLSSDSIKIEPQIRPKLRCKRCKKLFDKLSEVDFHMRTVHMPLKKKAESGAFIQCQYCRKSLSSNYVHRHESKCGLKPKSGTLDDQLRRKGPQLVFSLPPEESEDLKTDSYIRPVVRREGSVCSSRSTGIVHKTCDENNTGGESSTASKFCDNEKGDDENILRFSCKVCHLSYSSLRLCRQHIVSEHLQEVLKTPLIVPADTNRIEMELMEGMRQQRKSNSQESGSSSGHQDLSSFSTESSLPSLSPGIPPPGDPVTFTSAFQPVKSATPLPYNCLHCKNQNVSNSFEYLQDLHMHVLRCHVKKANYRCPLCSQEFSQHAFADHIVTAHRQGTPLSGIPENSFTESLSTAAAVSQVSPAAAATEASNRSSSLNSRQESFDDNFSTNSALDADDHPGETDWIVKCAICDEFMSYHNAKMHVLEVHGHQQQENVDNVDGDSRSSTADPAVLLGTLHPNFNDDI